MRNNIIYKFYDYDRISDQEYDISGHEYRNLINVCCKHSVVVSFIIKNQHELNYSLFERFRIPCPDNIKYEFSNYGLGTLTNEQIGVQYFKICPGLIELMANYYDSIFEWIHGWGYNNPEDPTFYREDGSVFFTSTIHEGELVLLPINDEDISTVICNANWKRQEDGSISCEKE